MEKGFFYHFGEFLYHKKIVIIILFALGFLACIPLANKVINSLNTLGLYAENSESVEAERYINQKLSYGTYRFVIIYKSDKWLATDPRFIKEVRDSLAGLNKLPVKHLPVTHDYRLGQISKDRHSAYAVVLFQSSVDLDPAIADTFKSLIKQPPNLKMLISGDAFFLKDGKTQTQNDLYRAEYIATPIAIIMMLLVFRSLIAAALPILCGGVSFILILSALYLISIAFNLSVFAVNIVVMLGLCLGLDYALLLTSRFRDEIAKGLSAQEATAITVATAGKSVFFSAIVVFVSLSALLFFNINVLTSIGIGGLATVVMTTLVSLIFLPSLLGLLDRKINKFPIKGMHIFHESHFMKNLTKKITLKPWPYFIGIVLILLILGSPFLHVKLGLTSITVLPQQLDSSQSYQIIKNQFEEGEAAPIYLLFKSKSGNLFTHENISALYDFTNSIIEDKRVNYLSSIYTIEKHLSKDQYHIFYGEADKIPDQYLDFTYQLSTRKDMSLATLIGNYPFQSEETIALVKKLRNSTVNNDISLQVAGSTAKMVDLFQTIYDRYLYAFIYILIINYLILLIVFQSLILPLKATLMNLLSLCASYGALVLVFQEGYFHQLLGFEPLGYLDINLLVLIFCGLFGISMDYEVFMLTRIKEYYERTKNNTVSIIEGTQHSSKVITSAALIVILICISFISADLITVKAFGLGIAVAVFVDAFLIRTILVPATMCLLDKWNWYLPKCIEDRLPKIKFDAE